MLELDTETTVIFQPELRRRLLHIVQSLQITNARLYRYAGQDFHVPATMPQQSNGPGSTSAATEAPIVQHLAGTLYNQAYCAVGTTSPAAVTAFADARLQARIREGIGQGHWSHGWHCYHHDQQRGMRHLQRGDNHVQVPQQQCQQSQAEQAPGLWSIFQSPQLPQWQSGFELIQGATIEDHFLASERVRLYFAARAEQAAELLCQVKTIFDAYDVPFRAKTLTAPAAYRRSDAAVAYIPRAYAPLAIELLTELPAELINNLHPQQPLFAAMLYPGIGTADDPGPGQSFGAHRCELLAGAIMRAWAAGKEHPEDILQAVAEQFRLAGYDPARPHLNPGRSDYIPTSNPACGSQHHA